MGWGSWAGGGRGREGGGEKLGNARREIGKTREEAKLRVNSAIGAFRGVPAGSPHGSASASFGRLPSDRAYTSRPPTITWRFKRGERLGAGEWEVRKWAMANCIETKKISSLRA